MDNEEDPFGSNRRRPAPPRLRLSSAASRHSNSSAHPSAHLLRPSTAHSEPSMTPPSPTSPSKPLPPRIAALDDEDSALFSHQPSTFQPYSSNYDTDASEHTIDDDRFQPPGSANPYGAYSSIPPVPPLPPHLAHLTSSSSLSPVALTPQALLSRLDQLLQAKSHEIQLAGQLGNSLLEQQAELELRINELEASGALNVGSSSNNKIRRDRERTPGPVTSASDMTSEEEGQEIGEDVQKKVKELEVEMRRWQEGNAEIWRQARGEVCRFF